MKLPRQPEKSVQRDIVKLLESIGASVYVLGVKRKRGDYQGTMQTPGLPDLHVFLPPAAKPLWIEVKAKGGRLRPAQQAFRDECEKRNQPHLVGGLDEVVAFLQQGGWLKVDRRTTIEVGR